MQVANTQRVHSEAAAAAPLPASTLAPPAGTSAEPPPQCTSAQQRQAPAERQVACGGEGRQEELASEIQLPLLPRVYPALHIAAATCVPSRRRSSRRACRRRGRLRGCVGGGAQATKERCVAALCRWCQHRCGSRPLSRLHPLAGRLLCRSSRVPDSAGALLLLLLLLHGLLLCLLQLLLLAAAPAAPAAAPAPAALAAAPLGTPVGARVAHSHLDHQSISPGVIKEPLPAGVGGWGGWWVGCRANAQSWGRGHRRRAPAPGPVARRRPPQLHLQFLADRVDGVSRGRLRSRRQLQHAARQRAVAAPPAAVLQLPLRLLASRLLGRLFFHRSGRALCCRWCTVGLCRLLLRLLLLRSDDVLLCQCIWVCVRAGPGTADAVGAAFGCGRQGGGAGQWTQAQQCINPRARQAQQAALAAGPPAARACTEGAAARELSRLGCQVGGHIVIEAAVAAVGTRPQRKQRAELACAEPLLRAGLGEMGKGGERQMRRSVRRGMRRGDACSARAGQLRRAQQALTRLASRFDLPRTSRWRSLSPAAATVGGAPSVALPRWPITAPTWMRPATLRTYSSLTGASPRAARSAAVSGAGGGAASAVAVAGPAGATSLIAGGSLCVSASRVVGRGAGCVRGARCGAEWRGCHNSLCMHAANTARTAWLPCQAAIGGFSSAAAHAAPTVAGRSGPLHTGAAYVPDSHGQPALGTDAAEQCSGCAARGSALSAASGRLQRRSVAASPRLARLLEERAYGQAGCLHGGDPHWVCIGAWHSTITTCIASWAAQVRRVCERRLHLVTRLAAVSCAAMANGPITRAGMR